MQALDEWPQTSAQRQPADHGGSSFRACNDIEPTAKAVHPHLHVDDAKVA